MSVALTPPPEDSQKKIDFQIPLYLVRIVIILVLSIRCIHVAWTAKAGKKFAMRKLWIILIITIVDLLGFFVSVYVMQLKVQ